MYFLQPEGNKANRNGLTSMGMILNPLKSTENNVIVFNEFWIVHPCYSGTSALWGTKYQGIFLPFLPHTPWVLPAHPTHGRWHNSHELLLLGLLRLLTSPSRAQHWLNPPCCHFAVNPTDSTCMVVTGHSQTQAFPVLLAAPKPTHPCSSQTLWRQSYLCACTGAPWLHPHIP